MKADFYRGTREEEKMKYINLLRVKENRIVMHIGEFVYSDAKKLTCLKKVANSKLAMAKRQYQKDRARERGKPWRKVNAREDGWENGPCGFFVSYEPRRKQAGRLFKAKKLYSLYVEKTWKKLEIEKLEFLE